MSVEEFRQREVSLEHVIKRSDTGLVFYRKCTVDGQSFNVNNSVLLRDEGRYKLGFLLKIYCRTKGNERALVRWFFTNSDLGEHSTEQQYSHEIFATSYTGKVAVSSIRKLVHVIWAANKDEIPESVPKDVYYVYRYFDHDKQGLVLHRQQLLQIRYMPKPTPDSTGSSLSVKEKADVDISTISFSLPYTENGSTFYKVCTIGKDKYKVGDCVLLGDRDGSSIRRIINFSYNHENRPIAMGQFIYYQNEVTLSPEERSAMHFQEVLVSNWKRELLISNIKRKLIVIHQNIFQPVPENALKAVYFLKRYYDPFKKKTYPLAEPLTRSDFSIVPAPMEDRTETAKLSDIIRTEGETSFYRDCTLGEENYSAGDFVTLQSGSVCVKVLRLYYNNNNIPVMDVNKLFTIRNVPSADRDLLTTSLLFSGEIYRNVACSLFFERVCVVFNTSDIANDATFVAGDYFDAEAKELYKLWKPAKLIGIEEVPKPGPSLRKVFSQDSESQTSESSSHSDSDYRTPDESSTTKKKKKKKKKNKKLNTSKAIEIKSESEKKRRVDHVDDEDQDERPKKSEKKEEVVKKPEEAAEPKKKAGDEKTSDFYSEFENKEVVVGGLLSDLEYSWVSVNTVKTCVGDSVFVKLSEGIQMGRIVSIYKDLKNEDDPVRLKLYRIYLEEEMFVSKRESASIHINEAFATDFVINALACQIDEPVDVVYLKKKEKIPPQNEIPTGRIFIRRYYHPRRHLLRALAQPLDSQDLSIKPQPHPPINGSDTENKNLNVKPEFPDGWKGLVRYSGEEFDKSEPTTGIAHSGAPKEVATDNVKPPLAVLAPKSVLSPQSSDLPFSGLTDLTDNLTEDANVASEPSDVPSEPPSSNFNKISIVSESDFVESDTMTILPSNMISFTVSNNENQTLQVVQTTDKQTIEITPNTDPPPATDSDHSVNTSEHQSVVPSDQPSTIEIVPQTEGSGTNQIQIVTGVTDQSEGSGTNQIQIVTGDSNQVQVITDTSSIQFVSDSSDTTSTFLPTIISSEQDMHSGMDVDITHAADGCITIAPVTTKRNNTAKFEDSYTKDGRVYFRKCHFKDETILQGESVYVRCNDQNLTDQDESWKLGRVMEFYHAKYPVVRLLWFYVVEEMVTSKNERAGIHPQEVFASQCDDEIEISSIESKANVIYLKKGETIPKVTEETDLFCRRFYDPYKHSIKALKNRLSATDITILPEPAVSTKRSRPSTSSTPQEAKTPDGKRKKISPSKPSGTPSRKQSPRKSRALETSHQKSSADTRSSVVSQSAEQVSVVDDSDKKLNLQVSEQVVPTVNDDELVRTEVNEKPDKQHSSPDLLSPVSDSLISAASSRTNTSNVQSNEDKIEKVENSSILTDASKTDMSQPGTADAELSTTDVDRTLPEVIKEESATNIPVTSLREETTERISEKTAEVTNTETRRSADSVPVTSDSVIDTVSNSNLSRESDLENKSNVRGAEAETVEKKNITSDSCVTL